MSKSTYHERDYLFGQTMLNVRTRVGITQVELAKILGVSRKAIGDWERGSSYPQAKHLKEFIALAIQYRAFTAERVVEEVRTIWQSAHQRVFLDEAWLAPLLQKPEEAAALQPIEQAVPPDQESPTPLVDWNNAMALPAFYGREQDIDLLMEWVVTERCHIVCVQGLGGIGKSALTINVMRRIADQFEVVIWRSMHEHHTFEELLDGLLQVFLPKSLSEGPAGLLQRQDILLEQMRKTRVLLVLDDFEEVIKKDESSGKLRAEFEGLERVLRLAAETGNQSCVLLTSREKPAVLVPLEGSQAAVRSLRLTPLDAESCNKLLSEKELIGSASDWLRLTEAYTGNPSALKIVANTIVDLFDGEIKPFLEKGEMIIGGVRNLLEEQFYRLTSLEQSLLMWLAILKRPTTIDHLLKVWEVPVSRARLLEAMDALYRRSLIERGFKPQEFVLQSLVTEYLTTWLITHVAAEGE